MRKVFMRLLCAILLGSVCILSGGCQKKLKRTKKSPSTRRLVAQSPAIAEILFKIGAGADLVGVSKHTRYPAAAGQCTQISVMPINLEVIGELRPSAIYVQSASPKLREFALHEKIPIRDFAIESVSDLLKAIDRLGQLTNREQTAKAEINRIKLVFAGLKKKRGSKKTVLVSIGRSAGSLKHIMTSSSGFLLECIESTGLKNAFGDLAARYPQLSLESIIDRDPDIIMELQGADLSEGERQQLINDWDDLGKLTAVKNKRVIVISGSEVLIPGPRVTSLLAKVQRALAKKQL
jgi:ABC-type Fe3+-hydroxamate transport system substrate-binding protein